MCTLCAAAPSKLGVIGFTLLEPRRVLGAGAKDWPSWVSLAGASVDSDFFWGGSSGVTLPLSASVKAVLFKATVEVLAPDPDFPLQPPLR